MRKKSAPAPKRPSKAATIVWRFDDGTEARMPLTEVKRREIELATKGLAKDFTRPAASRLLDKLAGDAAAGAYRRAQSRHAARQSRPLHVEDNDAESHTLPQIAAALAAKHPEDSARELFERLPAHLADLDIRCDADEHASDWRKSIVVVEGRRVTGATFQRYLKGRRRL